MFVGDSCRFGIVRTAFCPPVAGPRLRPGGAAGFRTYGYDALPDESGPCGALELKSIRSWVSGFFPGTLWLLYGETQDPSWLWRARRRTAALAGLSSYERTHDLGFMVGCPVGLGLRLTGDKAYERLLVETSETLLKRFDPKVGLIRSWDNKNRQPDPYLVIIDNMMNLEMLFEASRLTAIRGSAMSPSPCQHDASQPFPRGRERLSHRRLRLCHGSCARAPRRSGAILRLRRGPAVRAGASTALRCATARRRCALSGPCREERGVYSQPPESPQGRGSVLGFRPSGEERDASAGAVIASGLLELSEYVPREQSRRYVRAARRILRSLSSDRYLNAAGSAHGFLLSHSVGHKPKGSQVDVPIIYADYYFLEALLRYRQLD